MGRHGSILRWTPKGLSEVESQNERWRKGQKKEKERQRRQKETEWEVEREKTRVLAHRRTMTINISAFNNASLYAKNAYLRNTFTFLWKGKKKILRVKQEDNWKRDFFSGHSLPTYVLGTDTWAQLRHWRYFCVRDLCTMYETCAQWGLKDIVQLIICSLKKNHKDNGAHDFREKKSSTIKTWRTRVEKKVKERTITIFR